TSCARATGRRARTRFMQPNLDELKQRLPDHARDLRINLGVVAGSTALSPPQAWTIAVAAAHAARSPALVAAVEADAPLDATALAAAGGAAAILVAKHFYYLCVPVV